MGKERFLGENLSECLFEKIAKGAGFKVERGKRIDSPFPVTNKHGVLKKTLTTPDYYIYDEKLHFHIEVTKGAGKLDHKYAQIRVVLAAQTPNYIIITGDVREMLSEVDPETFRQILLDTLQIQQKTGYEILFPYE